MFVFLMVLSCQILSYVSVGEVLFSLFHFWCSDISFCFSVVVMIPFTVKSATFICVSSSIFPLLSQTSLHIEVFVVSHIKQFIPVSWVCYIQFEGCFVGFHHQILEVQSLIWNSQTSLFLFSFSLISLHYNMVTVTKC